MQLQRCPYYHFDSFKRHHYLTEGTNKSCWSWELRLHGRPIGFHSVNTALGMPGAGEGTSGGSREHRVVILPDFQGIGLGWMLAETVAAQLTSTGRRYTSITMHPTFGKCRDRSERWRPNARNHKADKDEATTDVRGRSLAQKAGTWAPTTTLPSLCPVKCWSHAFGPYCGAVLIGATMGVISGNQSWCMITW